MQLIARKRQFEAALVVLLLFVAVPSFCGCTGTTKNGNPAGKSTDAVSGTGGAGSVPNQASLQPLEIKGEKSIPISPASAFAIPLFASLFKNHGTDIKISDDGIKIDMKDYSHFSSQLAITFWKEAKTCIVANSYGESLLLSPLSWMLDAPILIYGNTTGSAMSILKPDSVISTDGVPIDTGIKLSTDGILDCTLQKARERNVNLKYAVFTNSNDSGSAVPYLSSLSALISAYRNGVIVQIADGYYPAGAVIETNATGIIQMVKKTITAINPNYVCIVGAPDSVPFIINKTIVEPTEGVLVASDNYYADTDDKPLFPEVAIGRILAANLIDASALFHRYVGYNEYLEESAVNQLSWQNCAFIYTVGSVEESIPCVEQTTKSLIDAEFTVYQSHSYASNVLAQQLLATANYNYLWMLDHGTVGGCGLADFSGIACHPSVVYSGGCNTGHTDNVTLKDTAVCKAINAGVASYVGPTRVAWAGLRIGAHDLTPYCRYTRDDYMAKTFFGRLAGQNLSVGIALKNAKINYFNDSFVFVIGSYPEDEYNYDDIDMVTLLESTLYGDPAFNPYEPCNEGK
ncbi:MAG: hypothetical protein CVT47_01680 [Thermoplasmata archaeon HGW-Thermoplasmata-2]|nr:MAG: hypothetical protein CVT47_01680 [Thermoplasmata archaeon HGW-Thermoplasmata-2]